MYRRVLKSLREYKKDAIKTPIFVTFEVVMEVMIPFLMADLIDKGIDAGAMPMVIKMGGMLLVAAFISLVFGVLAGRSAATAAAGFAKNLREDMFYNVQTFSFSNMDKFSDSSIITRLTTDVANVQNSFQMVVRMAARSPIMLVFSLIAAFTIHGSLSMIFLASIPVLGLGLFLIITKAYPVYQRVFKKYDRLNNIVQENLTGMRVVKSYIREEYEEKKFKTASQEIHDDFLVAEKLLALSMPLVQFLMYCTMLLLSWFGARAIVLSGNNPVTGLSTGELMSLITYTMQILVSLMMFSFVLVMITISRASVERISEVLEEESDLKDGEKKVTEVKVGTIEFDNVDFTYSKEADKLCLNKINLSIEEGETVGIIGGTGSSKTSLIQLIPRLYDATEGVVRVGGEDVKAYEIQALRDQVAVVLQKNVLFSGTIKENLRWGCEEATDEELIEMCKLAQAHEFIETFDKGYDTYIERGGANVSGGQKQRLCIARALLKKPKILILDDSTSAVDTKTDQCIRNSLLQHIPNTTKIIIAQRIGSIKEADKIIVMDDGCIVGMGNHDALIANNAIYREVYETQMKGDDDCA